VTRSPVTLEEARARLSRTAAALRAARITGQSAVRIGWYEQAFNQARATYLNCVEQRKAAHR
jgi:hypothetical protein